MPPTLQAHRYGKSEVRVMKVTRGAERHTLRDLTVDISLDGDFRAAYAEGDNTGMLSTDTMKNTVYALAQQHDIGELEPFGRILVERFVQAVPTVTSATVRIREHPWQRLGDHPHAFQRGAGGTRVATVSGDGSTLRFAAGVEDLLVLKTTGSGWAGYLHEEYTTLPETDDRIMATVVTAAWDYGDAGADLTGAWTRVRDRLLEAFGDHYSPSVQFTLHRMGTAVLEAEPQIERIHLSLPNRHHLLFDLSRFGLANENEIFTPTLEPYGLIEGTLERSASAEMPRVVPGADHAALPLESELADGAG
jgi:urate oxidase